MAIKTITITTDSSGDGIKNALIDGVLTFIDINPDESSSFDITIEKVLPDGEVDELYSSTGINSNVPVPPADMNYQNITISGPIRVTLANAGEHIRAAKVHFTYL